MHFKNPLPTSGPSMTIEQIAVSEFSTLKWSFEQDVHHLSKLGITGIGVCRQKLDDFGEEAGARALIDRSMRVSSLQWAGGFTGSDGVSFVDAIEDAKLAIYQAALTGASTLILHPGARNNHMQSHLRRLIRLALDELVPLANDYGITLGIEPTCNDMSRDFTFFHGVEPVLELVSEYGTNVGLVYDIYHMGQDKNCLRKLEKSAHAICLVQIADSHPKTQHEVDRLVPGDGTLPIRQILSILAEKGYDGFYELELYGRSINNLTYSEKIERAVTMFHHVSAGVITPQRLS
jgi:sugar phosphate isomerase/epimerase